MTAFLLAGTMVFAALAVFLKDMLKAVICLLISSVFLGIIFFRLNAPFAGVFEISVVAGLIVVLFILTISLTGGQKSFVEPSISLPIFLVLFFIFSYVLFVGIFRSGPAEEPVSMVEEYSKIGEVLWMGRALDTVGQISVIFAGVFVLLCVVGRKRDDK